MGKLFNDTKKQHTLFQAWRRIRQNGYSSSLEETRRAVDLFDSNANGNIIRIQRRLSSGDFQFDPQQGVTKKKGSGKGKRGIVMASVHNRIVERALLDVLQSRSPIARAVNSQPTSVGGVPERSVPHGLKLIKEAFDNGYRYFVRSDISGFFDGISRQAVIDKIASETDDDRFIELLTRATTVTLANEAALGEDRKAFPTDLEGVAQGSPLSPLFGNILLNDFDLQFNKDGVICIRFIDDFILLSKEKRRVDKAFVSAAAHLSDLGLQCHDPTKDVDGVKAAAGSIQDGFTFLGYDIQPGQFQPSTGARKKLRKSVEDRIRSGKREIINVMREPHADNSNRYVQTLVGIDRVLRGWGNSFAYGNAPETLNQLDQNIDQQLGAFRSWYAQRLRGQDWKTRRRTGGVCLLSEIRSKDLTAVPFRLEQGRRFVRSPKSITISTDGSVIGSRRHGRDKGPGGWAFVVHELDAEGAGHVQDVTNNQMELQAVIEALRATQSYESVLIRTDSQYVKQVANGEGVVKSNSEMWREYMELIKSRKVKIVWVKAHNGDPQNERADKLANEQAKLAADQRDAA